MKNHLIKAKVESISPLTDSILQVMLKPSQYIDYQPGQYLKILVDNNAWSYSIANAPLGSHTYELHIRHSPGHLASQCILNAMKQKGEISIHLPFGQCDLSHLQPEKPILFIAGGTGFAPIKAMIEQLLVEGTSRPFELFWSARSQSDLYMDDKVLQWQAHVSHFNYFSRISDAEETLIAMILARYAMHLNERQIVVSGPLDMVYSTRDALLAEGVLRENLYSDVF